MVVETYKAYNPRLSSNNFYGSDQSRLKTYIADRRIEEVNGATQQAKVYQQLAEQRGDMESADRLANMATMVINKFGQQVLSHTVPPGAPISQQPFDIRNYLKSVIQDGTLSQLWNRIKMIPKSQLSPKAQIIQHDIKHNKMLRDILNEKLTDIYTIHRGDIPLTPEQSIKQTNLLNYTEPKLNITVKDIIQTITGGDETVMQELTQKANSGLYEDLMKANMERVKNGGTSEAGSDASTAMTSDMRNPSSGRPPLTEEEINARIKLVKDTLSDASNIADTLNDMSYEFVQAYLYLKNKKYLSGSWKDPTWAKKSNEIQKMHSMI